jgi:apolipoprotein N-acyltransferase
MQNRKSINSGIPTAVLYLLALLAGMILPFAFAPFTFYPLAIIPPAILLAIWLRVNAKQAFWLGWVFGLGFFGVSVSWVYVSLHTYGNMDVLLAGFMTALFVMYLSVFPALQGYCFNRFFPENTKEKILFVFPASWVLFEALRGWVFTGFSWMLLGDSQSASPLKGLAPILSVYGVSFALAFTGALLVLFFLIKQWKSRAFILGSIAVLWISAALLLQIQWTHPVGDKLTVSLMQGNISQSLKWDPDHARKAVNLYYQLTQQHWNSDIIVWPEAAVILPYPEATEFLSNLNQTANNKGVALLTGLPYAQEGHYYNALLALGKGNGIYLKRHLVPFGEIMPLRSWTNMLGNLFDIPMSDLSSGPAKQPLLMAHNISLAPFICYEITYPQEVLASLNQAQAIVTVNDDSWFARSFAAAQQAQIAQMRSLETGRYQLFITNTGITAIIDPQGNIQTRIPQDQVGVLRGYIYAMEGMTPLMYYGIYPILGLLLARLVLTALRQRKRNKVVKVALIERNEIKEK